MADISVIQTPDGTSYNLKDATARPDLANKADKSNTVLSTTLSRDRKINTNVATGSFAFGENVEASGVFSTAFGSDTSARYERSFVFGVSNVPDLIFTNQWIQRPYDVGERVYYSPDNITSYIYECTTANNDTEFTESNWTQIGKYSPHVEIVGNGSFLNESNARALDWDGNEYLNGDIYVNCNADSTGGTKLTPTEYMTTSDIDAICV